MRRLVVVMALLPLAACLGSGGNVGAGSSLATPANVIEGLQARHIDTSRCTDEPAYCECLHTALVSGVSIEGAQQACSQ